MESSKGRHEMEKHVGWSRWYAKRLGDVIIQRWAEACSDRHNDCLRCALLEQCQDLIARLIACMDVAPARLREMRLEHQ